MKNFRFEYFLWKHFWYFVYIPTERKDLPSLPCQATAREASGELFRKLEIEFLALGRYWLMSDFYGKNFQGQSLVEFPLMASEGE